MAGSLRTHMQDSDHPVAQPEATSSQSGGRRKKRSRYGGSSCMKMGRSRKAKGGMKMSRSAKGGMGGFGFGAVIKEALVPFGLFAWQKSTQRKKSQNKSKRTRRR